MTLNLSHGLPGSLGMNWTEDDKRRDPLGWARADAEGLAAQYDYDVDALKYQWERRQFGSFTTTIDGSPEQRDRYRRAFEIAVARREASKRPAA